MCVDIDVDRESMLLTYKDNNNLYKHRLEYIFNISDLVHNRKELLNILTNSNKEKL